MGLLLSLPLAGVLGTVGSSCLAGLAFCFTSTAASMFFKSCNCNSSIATRVGFAMIFALNSMLAWLFKSPFIIQLLEKWSYDYIKMDCEDGKCYGVLAVHRICFSLALFHLILSMSLVGVNNTRDKRAAIQNGWWGPKVLLWLILVVVSFFIPNPFFMFWGNYVSLIGATIFVLLGLVLLVDFAHSWSETCLEKWEASNGRSNMWQWILIGSTASMYTAAFAMTGVLYAFFAGSECTLNRFFISFNLALVILVTVLCVHPYVQENNPRSGLAQSSMVAVYCTYLVLSAVGNHAHASCNPLHRGAAGAGARTTATVVGALFTFLAIAYSTTRAATQSRALVGKKTKEGAVRLAEDEHEVSIVNTQPSKTETPRYQALLAAVEAGAIPASALNEMQRGFDDDEDEEEVDGGETRDDERTGTRYNYSWFHIIFVLGAMYVAMLLTDWNVVTPGADDDVYIGRSETAMWIRIVSSWVCMLLYTWSLLAPALFPDRFSD